MNSLGPVTDDELPPEDPLLDVPLPEDPLLDVPLPDDPLVEVPLPEDPLLEVPLPEDPLLDVPLPEEPLVEVPLPEDPVLEVPLPEPLLEVPLLEPLWGGVKGMVPPPHPIRESMANAKTHIRRMPVDPRIGARRPKAIQVHSDRPAPEARNPMAHHGTNSRWN